MRTSRTLTSLTAHEWRYLLRAMAELLRARIVHATQPAGAIIAALQRPCEAGGTPRADLPLIGWALRSAAARVPWRSDCLVQSMAADRWLRRAGFNPRFHLGVRNGSEGQFLAHAWIEIDGEVITGGDDIAGYDVMIGNER